MTDIGNFQCLAFGLPEINFNNSDLSENIMFAIIELGNEQFRVEKDTIVRAQLQDKNVGDEWNVEKVLLVEKDGKTEVGKPYVSAQVKAKIVGETKGSKIYGFLYKKRKNIHRQWGHRQQYHKVQIVSIG